MKMRELKKGIFGGVGTSAREDPMKCVQIEFLHILTYFFGFCKLKNQKSKRHQNFLELWTFRPQTLGQKSDFQKIVKRAFKRLFQQHVYQFSAF